MSWQSILPSASIILNSTSSIITQTLIHISPLFEVASLPLRWKIGDEKMLHAPLSRLQTMSRARLHVATNSSATSQKLHLEDT
ncbi:hypothetical protein XH90_28265 [Bradyrhizobium sp. CCBAU 53338]|nr:hypothetical protein XH90_28265 [Bradyrhizobium sp. CCBAU 53338]